MANPQWTSSAQNAKPLSTTRSMGRLNGSGTAIGDSLTLKVSSEDPAKPLKSCLKKTSSFPTILDAGAAELGIDVEALKQRVKQKKKKMRRATSTDGSMPSSLRRSRRRRHQRSSDTTVTAKAPLRRCNTNPTPTALKSILKRSNTDPDSIKAKKDGIPKRVSFSDMSRWNSEGSGLNLKKLTNQDESKAPKGNYNWDKTTKSGKTTKPGSTLSVSVLNQEMKKFQAPGKPRRRGSAQHKTSSTTISPKSRSSPNLFEASLNEIHSSLVRDVVCPKLQAPIKPSRRGSVEMRPAVSSPKPYKGSNIFQASLVEFENSLVYLHQQGTGTNLKAQAPGKPHRRGSVEVGPADSLKCMIQAATKMPVH